MSPLEILATLATPVLLGGILYVLWGLGNGVFQWLRAIQRQLEEINATLKVLTWGEIAAQQRRLEADEILRIREEIAARAGRRSSPSPRRSSCRYALVQWGGVTLAGGASLP